MLRWPVSHLLRFTLFSRPLTCALCSDSALFSEVSEAKELVNAILRTAHDNDKQGHMSLSTRMYHHDHRLSKAPVTQPSSSRPLTPRDSNEEERSLEMSRPLTARESIEQGRRLEMASRPLTARDYGDIAPSDVRGALMAQLGHSTAPEEMQRGPTKTGADISHYIERQLSARAHVAYTTDNDRMPMTAREHSAHIPWDGLPRRRDPRDAGLYSRHAAQFGQREVPRATLAVDSNGDGRANYLVSGVDRNMDGIPDALQQVI